MDFSKDDHTPFVATERRHRLRLWVRVTEGGASYLHFYWRRIFVLLGLLAVAGWLSAATAAWAFVKYRRGYDNASWLNVAFYPVRREQYRTGLGQHYVAQGQIELAKQNYATGYSFLLAGLTRIPNDLPTRRLVAITQARLGRPDLSARTLADGAEFGAADTSYLKLMFGFMIEAREDELALAVTDRLLPAQPDTSLTHQYIALQAATINFQLGRFDETERIIFSWRLENTVEGLVLLARGHWERGETQLALNRIESQFARFNKFDEIYIQLIRFHRTLGNFDESRRYALLRSFNKPDIPGPRIDLLHSFRQSGDAPAQEKEVATFLAQFATDERALLLLAQFAAETGQPALADRVADTATAQGFSPLTFTLARAQARLAAQDYRGALELADATLRATGAEENPRVITLLHGVRAGALAGTRDPGRTATALDTFLSRPGLRVTDVLHVAAELKRQGALPQARLALERAHRLDPLHQAAITELVRLDAETSNRPGLAEGTQKLLALRRPSRAVLEEALLRLDRPEDADLREQIRATLAKTPATSTR